VQYKLLLPFGKSFVFQKKNLSVQYKLLPPYSMSFAIFLLSYVKFLKRSAKVCCIFLGGGGGGGLFLFSFFHAFIYFIFTFLFLFISYFQIENEVKGIIRVRFFSHLFTLTSCLTLCMTCFTTIFDQKNKISYKIEILCNNNLFLSLSRI